MQLQKHFPPLGRGRCLSQRMVQDLGVAGFAPIVLQVDCGLPLLRGEGGSCVSEGVLLTLHCVLLTCKGPEIREVFVLLVKAPEEGHHPHPHSEVDGAPQSTSPEGTLLPVLLRLGEGTFQPALCHSLHPRLFVITAVPGYGSCPPSAEEAKHPE